MDRAYCSVFKGMCGRLVRHRRQCTDLDEDCGLPGGIAQDEVHGTCRGLVPAHHLFIIIDIPSEVT